MTYVAINVLTVPTGRGEVLEERFAQRKQAVDTAPGFLKFELLRPVEGTEDYLVVTHWRSREDFEAWTASQSFHAGHASSTGRDPQRPPAATGSTIWAFDVVVESSATG
ncbi:MAG: antibiotic biosynthesis monooxygenase [Candidatus Nanopelagicales bacterium]